MYGLSVIDCLTVINGLNRCSVGVIVKVQIKNSKITFFESLNSCEKNFFFFDSVILT